MSASPDSYIGPIPSGDTSVRNLILGRLALIVLILIAGFLWVSSYTTDPLRAIPRTLIGLFFFALALSMLYGIWLRYGPSRVWQIRSQFVIDALLVTWLVWETGDLISPYITLYIILISVAGLYLRKIDVHLLAGFSSVCFTVLCVLTAQSVIYSFSGDVTTSRAVQIILVHVVAFLLVGLLSGRLAEKRRLGEELRRTEEEFADLNVLQERILSSINSGLITTDLQGKIRAFNRAAEEASGIKANEAIGKSVFTVFGDEIRAPIEMCLTGVQNLEFSPPNFEAVIRDASANGDGKNTTVACSVSPLIRRSGGVNGLIIAFQDKTELHEMEENLRRADRLSAVGRMAAGLAHEIRNPLGSISSAVQFLSEKPNDRTELMDVVIRESDRLNKIIQDFLAYARPEASSGSRAKLESVVLQKAIEDCVVLLRHDPAVAKSHTFETSFAKDSTVVLADETQIKQICWNLMQNAVQAMPQGGTLNIKVDEPAANLARIIFSDEGCGIARDNLVNIFEPFQRGARGTGLGLSIVHRIVTQIGGRIDVESKKDVGTKITIELPKENAETFDR